MTDDPALVDARGEAENLFVEAPVRVHARGEHPGVRTRFEHHGPRPVSEENAGRAVLHVDDTRHRFGADHDGAAVGTRAQHGVGGVQGVNEARAHGLHVKGGAALSAESRLHARGGRREDHVGGRRRDDDEVDRITRDARRFESVLRGFDRERRRAFALFGVGEVARHDPRARADPLVACFYAVLGEQQSELFVGERLFGQGRTRADDAGVHALIFLLIFSMRPMLTTRSRRRGTGRKAITKNCFSQSLAGKRKGTPYRSPFRLFADVLLNTQTGSCFLVGPGIHRERLRAILPWGRASDHFGFRFDAARETPWFEEASCREKRPTDRRNYSSIFVVITFLPR